MADFVEFNEGADYITAHGWPSMTYFLLSSYPVGVLTALSKLSTGVGEITGSGYSRQYQVTPPSVGGVIPFVTMAWFTGAAIDWPANVVSIIAATTLNNSGVALCAWNLQPGAVPRNLSTINTTEQVTPTYIA